MSAASILTGYSKICLRQVLQLYESSILNCWTTCLTQLDMRWHDAVKASYHHIKHYIVWHRLFTVSCFMWQNLWRHWFFKLVILLNAGKASCLTCSNLRSSSSGLWVCAPQMCDWFITTGTQIDEQTGTRRPALSEGKYAGGMWLITATRLLTESFRRVVKPNQKQVRWRQTKVARLRSIPPLDIRDDII